MEYSFCGKAVDARADSGTRNETNVNDKIRQKMKTDKGQFDEVLRRMLQKPPQKTAEIKAPKKRSKPSRKSGH